MSRRNYSSRAMYNEYSEEPEFPVEEETTAPEPKKGIITHAKLVNLRRSPSMDGKVIIGTVSENDKCMILETAGVFLKVRMDDGRTGFVSSDFCEEV